MFFHGALGDCVLLWPLLRALAPLTLVGPAGAGRLAERELHGVKAIEDGTAEWSRLFADDTGAARGAHAPAPRNVGVRGALANARRVGL